MPVRVNINHAALAAKFEADKKRVAMAVAEQILGDCRPFVPQQEGILQSSGNIRAAADGAEVYWDTPYAAYQYYGCWPDGSHVIRNHTTPGTTTMWCEEARRRYESDWTIVANNALKGG